MDTRLQGGDQRPAPGSGTCFVQGQHLRMGGARTLMNTGSDQMSPRVDHQGAHPRIGVGTGSDGLPQRPAQQPPPFGGDWSHSGLASVHRGIGGADGAPQHPYRLDRVRMGEDGCACHEDIRAGGRGQRGGLGRDAAVYL